MSRLPKFLKEYFWDVKFEDLDISRWRIFILRRILEYGNDKAADWMRKTFTQSEIKEALCNYRGYSKKSANFWALVLGIPKEEVLCLKKSSSKIPKSIWPY
jgi:hypothetical protein